MEAVADVALKYQRCEGQDVAADVSGEQHRRACGSGGRRGTEISKVESGRMWPLMCLASSTGARVEAVADVALKYQRWRVVRCNC